MKRLLLTFGIIAGLINTCFAAGGIQQKKFLQNSGGLIDHISPLLIPESKAVYLNNITLDNRGQLTIRNGYTITNTTGALTTSAVTGGGYQNPSTGSNYFAVIIGTNVYRTSNSFGGSYTNVTSTVTLTASASNLAQHTALNDVMVFCNESDTPFKVTTSGNAFALLGAPTGAKTCTTFGSYLIVANTTESGTNYSARVRWSDVNNPDSWPANNYIDIEPNDGDRITSVIAFKDSVYIFKKRSIYRMLITGSDGADAFIIRPFTRNIGAWAKNSVRVIPNLGIAFLAQNTLYVLGDNELSSQNYSQLEAVGDPIQRTFDTVQRAQWANAVGAVYPHKYQYWLSVSTSGTTNNEIFVYDYIQKSWTTYGGIAANMLEQAEDNTGQNILISGDYSGNVYKQDTGTSDNPLNVARAINWAYTTPDLIFDTPDLTKNFKYMYLFSTVDVNTTVSIGMAYDYNSSYESSTNIILGSSSALYDTAVYDTAIYPASGNAATRIELNRSAKAIKLNFAGSSSISSTGLIGWSILYTVEDYKQ